jgi:hypothetical protein
VGRKRADEAYEQRSKLKSDNLASAGFPQQARLPAARPCTSIKTSQIAARPVSIAFHIPLIDNPAASLSPFLRMNSMSSSRFASLLFAVFVFAGLSFTQSVKEDVDKAAHDTADATKKATNKTVDATKKAAHKTKQATVHAADKTADATKDAADATKNTAVKAGDATADAAHKTGDAVKTGTKKTVDKTKEAADKTKDAVAK